MRTIKAEKIYARHVVVNRKTARTLAGMYGLPAAGQLLAVAIGKPFGTLLLAYDDGEYTLQANGYIVDQWPEIFQLQAVSTVGAQKGA